MQSLVYQQLKQILLMILGIAICHQAHAISKQEVIDTVNLSPYYVGQHDKQSWLELFADQALVEDPVGAVKSRGEEAFSSFYNIFIAPNDIRFEVKQDYVAGNEIVRDLDIVTNIGDYVKVVTPAYLYYEVVEENAQLKIKHMAAHWEIEEQFLSLISQLGGLTEASNLGERMIQEWGVFGALDYFKVFAVGIFDKGKQSLQQFAESVNTNDESALSRLFTWFNQGVEFPVNGQSFNVPEFADEISKISNLEFNDAFSSGWVTSARFTLDYNGEPKSGVAIVRFNPWFQCIDRARFFWNE